MQIAKPVHILLFIICFALSGSVNSKQDPITPENKTDIKTTSNQSKLVFSIPLGKLEQNNTTDEALWIDVDKNKHLILIRQTNGRKERGNILLLHAQGENADHLRLIQPLSKQLSRLGWNLFIPNIALESFPQHPAVQNKALQKNNQQQQKNVENTANGLSDQELTNASAQNTEKNSTEDTHFQNSNSLPIVSKNYYFENSQAYQNYFNSLCQAVFNQTEVTKQPFIVIANQNAAYWSLPCLNQQNQSMPTIFLQPQLPLDVEDNLAELLAKQKKPIFSFHIKSSSTDPFSNAFKKRVLHSKYQRFNIGMLGTTKLQTENTDIARTITGWIDKQWKK